MPILSSQERIGTVIGGKYAIARLIGEGGMGAVFEAEHRMTRRRVAIKLLQPELALQGDAVARFVQEAHAATAIAHPNIVQVLDMGTDETGAVYLVLEFLAGEDLGARLARQGRLALHEALEVLLPVMDALAVAHGKGIVHRDLKPANIFLARQDNGLLVPKLLDFGISKISGQNALAHTATGAVLGTPYYMAPEQARGQKDLDHLVDVWAMGVVLYQCLSGELPFRADNYNEMIIKLVTEEPPSLAERAPGLDPGVVTTVMRALSKDRARRVPSIGELAATLARLVQRPSQTGPYAALADTSAGRAAPPVPYAAPGVTPAPTPSPFVPAAAPPAPSMPSVPSAQPVAGAGGALPATNMAWQGRASNTGAAAAAGSRAGLVLGVGAVVIFLGAAVGIGIKLRPRAAGPAGTQPTVQPAAPPPVAPAAAAALQPAQPAQAQPAEQPDAGAPAPVAEAAADPHRTATRAGHARTSESQPRSRSSSSPSSSSSSHGIMLRWGER